MTEQLSTAQEGLIAEGKEGTFRSYGSSLSLFVVVLIWVYTNENCEHLKWVHFVVCKSYLNKNDLKPYTKWCRESLTRPILSAILIVSGWDLHKPNCKDTEEFRVFCQYTTMELRGKTLTLHLAFILGLSIGLLLSCLRKRNASILGHILSFNYKSFHSTSCLLQAKLFSCLSYDVITFMSAFS